MQNDDQNETAYLERIKQGDVASYSYFVEKYRDMALTISSRILRREDDAMDATQESFVKAFQQLSTFQRKSKFSTWFYTIVYRTALNKNRENQLDLFRRNKYIADSDYLSISESSSMNQLNEKSIKIINDAIGNLSKIDSTLITLYYMNDSTIKELHEITGLSETNIKVRLFRARKKLEIELKPLIQKD